MAWFPTLARTSFFQTAGSRIDTNRHRIHLESDRYVMMCDVDQVQIIGEDDQEPMRLVDHSHVTQAGNLPVDQWTDSFTSNNISP